MEVSKCVGFFKVLNVLSLYGCFFWGSCLSRCVVGFVLIVECNFWRIVGSNSYVIKDMLMVVLVGNINLVILLFYGFI